MKEPITTERMDGMDEFEHAKRNLADLQENQSIISAWESFADRILRNYKCSRLDYVKYMEWAKTQDWYKSDEPDQ